MQTFRFGLLAFMLTLAANTFAATTWYVNGVNGKDTDNCTSASTACKTITHAVSLAAAGDSIQVAAAVYPENLNIGISLNITGASATTTIIDGGGSGSVVFIGAPTRGAIVKASLSGLTFRNGNSGSEPGGGIQCFGSLNGEPTLAISNSIITGNTTSNSLGGGIFSSCSSVVINKSTISNNSAPTGFGGGIYCSPDSSLSNFTIDNSTINNNSAAQGGGMVTAGKCASTITNTTISGNTSHSDGGAILQSGAAMLINNSTISGNTAGSSGAGIYTASPSIVTPVLQNSILAGNLITNGTDANCGFDIATNGYNISSDKTCHFAATGDRNNTNPLLGPLQNNGGPTETMAIPSDSPAIDAGNPAGCTDGHSHVLTTDQRGDHRPGDPKLKTGCDIGAYEYQFPK
jgi:predicted outer membrane repeat protein